MPAANMPAAEVEITDQLVRGLLDAQHPDLANLPLTLMANGWDNVIYQLGNEFTIRLPRREMSAPLIGHEQQWLAMLAPLLPTPIPAPLRRGEPSALYRWRWSICPLLPGSIAATAPLIDKSSVAQHLGKFLAALHTPSPIDAPINPYRGGPLRDREAVSLERLDQLADVISVAPLGTLWHQLAQVPDWPHPPVWLHGDLHPANILVDAHGQLSGVIDFGDICGGDPATDLSIGWLFFDEPERAAFRAAVGYVDDDTWARARGWALVFTLAYLGSSGDNPIMAEIGFAALPRILGQVETRP